MRAALGATGIVGGFNEKFRCDLREPVYDDSQTPRVPRADFFTA